jgi:hypothetical protein
MSGGLTTLSGSKNSSRTRSLNRNGIVRLHEIATSSMVRIYLAESRIANRMVS